MSDDSLSFSVSLDLALRAAGAPSAAAHDAAVKKTEDALFWLIEQRRTGALGAPSMESRAKHAGEMELLTIVEREDDIALAATAAEGLKKNASEVFVLGTGGSSLGAQALAELSTDRRKPHVRFFDNLDPLSFERALARADLKTTRFLAISKSGTTPETMMQTLAAADALKRAGLSAYLNDHFAVVTEPKASPLRAFAEGIGARTVDHPTGIGGRYSVLSVVGLLPAMLMGLDARAVRKGARDVLDHALAGACAISVPAAAGAAMHLALMAEGRIRETVLWAYADKLKTFGAWWRQLWAESLGKNGMGVTPVAALGPVDQHSQLQLFLDGPGETFFTLIATDACGTGPEIPAEDANRIGVGYLAGKRIGDLVDAEARATAETLAKRGRPVRRIRVPTIDERAMGALFMHFMLETIITGRGMGVDPFDQPAVEEGKVLARQYLAEGRR
jgi:glucose-6-phosphate isomerase